MRALERLSLRWDGIPSFVGFDSLSLGDADNVQYSTNTSKCVAHCKDGGCDNDDAAEAQEVPLEYQ